MQGLIPSKEIALDLEWGPDSSQLSIPSIPNFPLVGHEVRLDQQDEVAQRLIEKFQGKDLLVLGLGFQKRPTRTIGKTFYGIIMVPKKYRGVKYWRRLGAVSWEVFDLPRRLVLAGDKAVLHIKGKEWHDLEGLYG